MGDTSGAPISVVVQLDPTVDTTRLQRALTEWLEKAYGVPLESQERDGLVVEWRKSDESAFACQLVTSTSGDKSRRTVTVFRDDIGAIAILEETPLAASDSPHTIVDLSEPLRLLLETLIPITSRISGLNRGNLNELGTPDPKELTSVLSTDLTPGMLVAVTAGPGTALSVAQDALLSDLSGLAIVASMPAVSDFFDFLGLPTAPRAGSVVTVSRTASGLDAHLIGSSSLRTKLDSARRLVVRRQLSAPIPFDLERRRSAAMTQLLAGGNEVDLPTALSLLDEESQRANELNNRVKDLETSLDRAFEEQDAALRQLDDALSRLRYLDRAFKSLGEIPTVEADFNDDWQPDSSLEAVEAARELLEFLVINVDLDNCKALDTQQKRGVWGKKIWMALRALNEYCKAKTEDRFTGDIAMYRDNPPSAAIPLLADYAASESEPTTNSPNLRAIRTFGVPTTVDPSGRIYMEQHLKIDRGGQSAPRIHLYDDSGGPTQRVYVGYIGAHLPTWSAF